MRIDFFRYEFKRIEGLWITPDWMLFRKPLELWNKNTGEVIRFKTFEAMLDYELEDATMRQRIGAMPKLPTVMIDGGKRGDYVFRKGSHFKASAFVKAVQTARMSGTSYDEAVDRWLKANQRKYGYKYHFAKA